MTFKIVRLLQAFSSVIFVQLCGSWQNCNWHSASRTLFAIAELLVLSLTYAYFHRNKIGTTRNVELHVSDCTTPISYACSCYMPGDSRLAYHHVAIGAASEAGPQATSHARQTVNTLYTTCSRRWRRDYRLIARNKPSLPSLPTTLAGKIKQSVASIQQRGMFVSTLFLKPTDLWTWVLCVWIMTIGRLRLKVKVIGQGQMLMSVRVGVVTQ